MKISTSHRTPIVSMLPTSKWEVSCHQGYDGKPGSSRDRNTRHATLKPNYRNWQATNAIMFPSNRCNNEIIVTGGIISSLVASPRRFTAKIGRIGRKYLLHYNTYIHRYHLTSIPKGGIGRVHDRLHLRFEPTFRTFRLKYKWQT